MPQVLELDYELGNCFCRFLGDRIEVAHQFALGYSVMKELDELILELFELIELGNVVL